MKGAAATLMRRSSPVEKSSHANRFFFKFILYFDNPNPTKRAARPALGLRLAPPVAVQEVAYASASNRNKY